MITHQQIADRWEELNTEGLKAYRVAKDAYDAKVGAEMKNLQETCEGIGHIWHQEDNFGTKYAKCAVCKIRKSE